MTESQGVRRMPRLPDTFELEVQNLDLKFNSESHNIPLSNKGTGFKRLGTFKKSYLQPLLRITEPVPLFIGQGTGEVFFQKNGIESEANSNGQCQSGM